jgi:hypothetical protein
MQKIQKFHFGRLYAAPRSTKTYELIERNGQLLTFLVKNPRNGDSWKQRATSAYKADASGAFEEVLLSTGVRLRADSWCQDPRKVEDMAPATQVEIVKLMADLAA